MLKIEHNLESLRSFFVTSLGHLRHGQTTILKYDHGIANAQTFPILNFTSGAIEFKKARYFRNYIENCRAKQSLIFIQSKWNIPVEEVAAAVEAVRASQEEAKIVFLDWYAPIHIPQPEILEMVDLYVKKQALKDTSGYAGMHDTNLVEYELQWNEGFKEGHKYIKIEKELLDEKLFVGWNFATDRRCIDQLAKRLYSNSDRPIDIHCRMCAPQTRKDWYEHMRGRAYDAVRALGSKHHSDMNILNENVRIKYPRYIDEIVHSKLCISPFGYGEVCWRDFEAIFSGALLIKPDMGHLATNPNIYIPYETYVPCKWDFSDLDDRCTYYLNNESERSRITTNAVRAWETFLKQGWLELWDSMTARLAIAPLQARPLASNG